MKRVAKALHNTTTDVELEREQAALRRGPVADAIEILQDSPSVRQAQKAIRLLKKHRGDLRLCDRMTLRDKVIPVMRRDPEQAEQVQALAELARRPKTLDERVKSTAKALVATVHERVTKAGAPSPTDKAPATEPKSRTPQTPREAIEQALASLREAPSDGPKATRRALKTLVTHQSQLKTEHREQLFERARQWTPDTGLGAQRRLAERIVRASADAEPFTAARKSMAPLRAWSSRRPRTGRPRAARFGRWPGTGRTSPTSIVRNCSTSPELVGFRPRAHWLSLCDGTTRRSW